MWVLLEQVCLKLLWNQESHHLINGNKKGLLVGPERFNVVT